jgi:hypothetical protein
MMQRRLGNQPPFHVDCAFVRLEPNLYQADLELNLSWVLREPSASHTVRRTSLAALRFERRRARLIRHFSALSGDDLRRRVLIDPRLSEMSDDIDDAVEVISASCGLFELLPRILALDWTGSPLEKIARRQPDLTIVDQHRGHSSSTCLLFNGPAQLELPENFQTGSPSCALVLIVRPGENDMLLTGGLIPQSNPGETRMLAPLESIIRDFAEQWLPGHALWPQPMEVTFPEICERATVFDGS